MKDLLQIVSGTSLAQLIGVLVVPFLARLYTPGDFGTMAIFVSTAGILVTAACLRYELAIVLPESREDALNLLAMSLFFSLMVSLLSALLITLFGQPLAVLLQAPKIIPYLWLLPLTIFSVGVYQAVSYWNSRVRRFDRTSVSRVVNSTVASGAQLGFGLWGAGSAGGLISGYFGGALVSSAVLLFWVIRDEWKLAVETVRLKRILELLRRYRKFPLFSLWSGVLNTVSWQLPTFLLSGYFSTTITGYYDLGNKLLRIPMNLIGAGISQAFLPRAADARSAGNLSHLVEAALEKLVQFTLFPLLILSCIGRDLFVIVFGNAWAEAGVYTQILSLWMFFWFISSPLSNIFTVLERQEFNLRLDLVIFATRWISLTVGGLLNNPRLALALFAVSGVLVYGYLCLAILHISGVPVRRLFHISWPIFLAFVPWGLVLVLLALSRAAAWMTVSVGAAALLGYFGWFLWKRKNVFTLKPV